LYKYFLRNSPRTSVFFIQVITSAPSSSSCKRSFLSFLVFSFSFFNHYCTFLLHIFLLLAARSSSSSSFSYLSFLAFSFSFIMHKVYFNKFWVYFLNPLDVVFVILWVYFCNPLSVFLLSFECISEVPLSSNLARKSFSWRRRKKKSHL